MIGVDPATPRQALNPIGLSLWIEDQDRDQGPRDPIPLAAALLRLSEAELRGEIQILAAKTPALSTNGLGRGSLSAEAHHRARVSWAPQPEFSRWVGLSADLLRFLWQQI